jgi:hypothetical protein
MKRVRVTPLQAAKDNWDRLNAQANLMALVPPDVKDIMRGLLSTAETVVEREQLKVDEAAAEKRQSYYGKAPY